VTPEASDAVPIYVVAEEIAGVVVEPDATGAAIPTPLFTEKEVAPVVVHDRVAADPELTVEGFAESVQARLLPPLG
jgi:hypothetical protein